MNEDMFDVVLAFAIDLYKQRFVSDGVNTENVVSSPLSIAAILSMIFAGVRGHTVDVMARVLRIEDAHYSRRFRAAHRTQRCSLRTSSTVRRLLGSSKST
ncbi:hypothetical protein MRX96_036826 [Rhipicephalus microplus]